MEADFTKSMEISFLKGRKNLLESTPKILNEILVISFVKSHFALNLGL